MIRKQFDKAVQANFETSKQSSKEIDNLLYIIFAALLENSPK